MREDLCQWFYGNLASESSDFLCLPDLLCPCSSSEELVSEVIMVRKPLNSFNRRSQDLIVTQHHLGFLTFPVQQTAKAIKRSWRSSEYIVVVVVEDGGKQGFPDESTWRAFAGKQGRRKRRKPNIDLILNLSSNTKWNFRATSWHNSLIYFIVNCQWLFVSTIKDVNPKKET